MKFMTALVSIGAILIVLETLKVIAWKGSYGEEIQGMSTPTADTPIPSTSTTELSVKDRAIIKAARVDIDDFKRRFLSNYQSSN